MKLDKNLENMLINSFNKFKKKNNQIFKVNFEVNNEKINIIIFYYSNNNPIPKHLVIQKLRSEIKK